MYRNSLFILLLVLAFGSCKRINPDKPSYEGEPVALPKATSSINLNMEIPLSYLEDELNNNLNSLLYSEKSLEIGNGLFADITINRTGSLRMNVNAQNNLTMKLPILIDGQLKLEKKLFGQVVSTSIPFKETLIPELSFLPEIGENWELNITDLQIESWGKSLKYDLLGYQIDFEPIIKNKVKAMLEQQLTTDGQSNISFRPLAEQTWKAYSKPFHLKNGKMDMYLFTIPEKIKIGESFTSDQKLQLNIGLEGEVFTQLDTEPQNSPKPLPAVFANSATDSNLDITLPVSIQYTSIDKYLNEELSGKGFRIDSNTELIPKNFNTQHFGDRALVKMGFTAKRSNKKDLTGELFLVGKPVYDKESESITFENIDFDLNTENLLTNSANWLKQRQILEAIKKHAVYPIGEYVQEARSQLQDMGYLNTAFASIGIRDTELSVLGIYTTEKDIRLYLRSTGETDVRVREKTN